MVFRQWMLGSKLTAPPDKEANLQTNQGAIFLKYFGACFNVGIFLPFVAMFPRDALCMMHSNLSANTGIGTSLHSVKTGSQPPFPPAIL